MKIWSTLAFLKDLFVSRLEKTVINVVPKTKKTFSVLNINSSLPKLMSRIIECSDFTTLGV